jgi:hypothetical protein
MAPVHPKHQSSPQKITQASHLDALEAGEFGHSPSRNYSRSAMSATRRPFRNPIRNGSVVQFQKRRKPRSHPTELFSVEEVAMNKFEDSVPTAVVVGCGAMFVVRATAYADPYEARRSVKLRETSGLGLSLKVPLERPERAWLSAVVSWAPFRRCVPV